MANPNIVNVAQIYGKTVVANVTTVSTNVVSNAVNSSNVFKINNLFVTNITTSNVANVTVSVLRSSIEYKFAEGISVPPSSTILIVTKDTSLYLEEGDAIRLNSSANSTLQAILSYEQII
jgi:hypothetical protein